MRPFITLEGQARDALDLYESIFPGFSLDSVQHHAEPHADLIMLAAFSIRGQDLLISDSFISHEWSITPAISFFLDLEDAADLERLAAALSDEGKVHMPAGDYGFSSRFAWVEDRFGVNWQLNLA